MTRPHSLLIFHGSARASATKAAATFAERLRDLGRAPDFSVCFLRGAEPSLDEALKNAIAKGHLYLRLIPLFLLPGSHINEDIPASIEKCTKENPDLKCEVAECLVENPEFVDFIANEISRD